MYKKPIISFEGIEGSGKTFHINNVAKFLKKKDLNYPVIFPILTKKPVNI